MKEVDKALDDLIDKAYARYLREMRLDVPCCDDTPGDNNHHGDDNILASKPRRIDPKE